jgi:hypothetical protein
MSSTLFVPKNGCLILKQPSSKEDILRLGTRPTFRGGRSGEPRIYAGGGTRGNNIPGAIPAVKPGVPGNPVAEAGDGEATVTWTAALPGGSGVITGYSVRKHATNGTVLATEAVGDVLTADITADNDTAVKFTVAAVSAQGTGQYTEYSNTVTPTAP